METINLGRVAFVYKGDYSAVTTYNKMDVVFDGESSFVSQIDNNVGNPLVNGLNWKYLSRGNNLELQEVKQDIATLETKADKTTQVVAGNGLTGGGALSGDVTVNVGNTDDSIVVGTDGIKVDTQDSLTSTSTTKPLSAAQGKALQDNKAEKTRTITAGNGLTGGGDLTADRTINIANADDSLVVTADNVKVNTNNTLTSTSTTQPLSANQGKVLNEKVVQVETDLNLDEYTIAEAFNLLYRKIISLETIIANGVFKNLQVDNLTTVNAFNYNGAPLIVIGSTAPTSAPDFVGQTYINTTAPGTIYSAKGNASVSDWKQTSN